MIKQKTRLIAEGHRGFRPLENSYEGFEKTLSNGSHGFETDVWLTKDKRLIVTHGDSTMGLLKLKHVRTGKIVLTFTKDLLYDEIDNYIYFKTGKPIVKLDRLLDIVKKKPELYLNLEIKESRILLIEILAELLTIKNLANEIQMSSFYHEVKKFKDELSGKFPILKKIGFGYLAADLVGFESLIISFGISRYTG